MTRAGCRRVLASVFAVALLAACSGAPDEDDEKPAATPSSTPASAAVDDVVDADEPVSEETQGVGLLLSEVGSAPADGDEAFVEVVNAGPDPVDTTDVVLDVDGREVAVETDRGVLDPGAVVLVETDLDPTSGEVGLRNGAGQLLDRVAWGDAPGAVPRGSGDIVPDELEAGSTAGRPPGSESSYDSTGWVTFAPAQASPGEPNPVPPADVLLPIPGTVLLGPTATLSWFAVAGAESYDVEVATDDEFTDVVQAASVTEPLLATEKLDPGAYVWRVEAVAPAGERSGWSEPGDFELEPAGAERTTPRAAVSKRLPVPFFAQRKDTSMLLLEAPHEHQPMAWDAPHYPPNRRDPADAKNCAIATVAMINHFYGGDLSQDRIGYQIRKDIEAGPEWDLNYGTGLTTSEVSRAYAWALGEPVAFVAGFTSVDQVWEEVTGSIDLGRPLGAAIPRHSFAITGYRVDGSGKRYMSINDPARGQEEVNLDNPRLKPGLLKLWIMPRSARGTKQEPGVTRDGDGDGMVDFDETERFKTDPAKADSDGDQLKDKADVVTGVFDTKYGYARKRDRTGRDFDGDDLPTERDPDSDNGECEDGREDTSGDGHRNGSETWNFDVADDACFGLVGTLTYKRNGSLDTGPDGVTRQVSQETASFTIDVELVVDPDDPSSLVDSGSSSFTVVRRHEGTYTIDGECSDKLVSVSQGTYKFSDPPVPSPGHTPDEIGDGHSYIGALVDSYTGIVIVQIVPYYPETVERSCTITEDPFGFPIVVDTLACDVKYGYAGLGIVGKIVDLPDGPDEVEVKCTEHNSNAFWHDQTVKASGTLKLVVDRD